MNRTAHPHHARGFTLIEVTLALVLSGLVLAGCLSVFVALRNAEHAFATRFEHTNQLDITHTSFSRALLSLQMKEAEASTVVRAGSEEEAPEEDEQIDRGRLILETDMTVEPDSTGWLPQRFEVVCATPPVPSGLASRAAEWYTAQDKEDSLDFSALDGSQGITRGVFELKPTGHRERIMQRLGLISASDAFLTEAQLREQLDPNAPPNWTLWWRPILTAEAQQLTEGYGPLPDTVGEEADIRERLAGAIPLLHNIERCIWELYKEDQFINEHVGLEMEDLPAYAQFEVILTNQQYASWMFEIDWVIVEDPIEVASGGSSTSDTGTDTDADPNGNNTGNGGGGGGGRPGGNNNGNNNNGQTGGPGGTRFDLSGDS